MNRLVNRCKSALVWILAKEAPRGIVASLVAIWTVGFMSALVWQVSERLFSEAPPAIGGGAATAYSALLGTGLAGAFALFKWAAGGKDKAEK